MACALLNSQSFTSNVFLEQILFYPETPFCKFTVLPVTKLMMTFPVLVYPVGTRETTEALLAIEEFCFPLAAVAIVLAPPGG